MSGDDPYLIPGTDVLRHHRNLRDAAALERWETRASGGRLLELEDGTVAIPGSWDFTHLCAFHRHLFGDVYSWAGEPRTVDIARGNSLFCRAIYLDTEAERIFTELAERNHLRRLTRPVFVSGAAWLLGEINALHPFREGNGRTQRAFLAAVGASRPDPGPGSCRRSNNVQFAGRSPYSTGQEGIRK